MDPEISWLRIKLSQWGRLARAVGVGYPSMASFERARIGRGGVFSGPEMPEDLAEIDWQITRAPPQHKLMLVECYTKTGDWKDHRARLQLAFGPLSVDAYFRRKKRAEVYLNTALRAANEIEMLRAS